MRVESDLHNDDLDSVTSLHSNDSHYSCSTAAGGVVSGGLFRRSPITVRTSTPPGRSDSPGCYPSTAASPPPSYQYQTITASSTAASTTTNAANPTPLLKASLNAPVAAYYTSYRNKGDVVSSQASSISILATTKHKPDDLNGLSNVQSSFYSSLVHQLKAKTGQSSDTTASKNMHGVTVNGHSPTNRSNSNGKKEKSKALPFVCKVCNKRFQRHIALNAHFQNEHITSGTHCGERSCKLCGASAAGLSGIRLHLRSVHNIDLDNPTKCLEDGKNSALVVTSKPSPIILEVCTRPVGPQLLAQEEMEPSCSNIEMYEDHSSCSPTASISPSPARTPSSSASPERSLFSFKQDICQPHINIDNDDPQVEDLRIRKPSPVLSRRCSPAPGSGAAGHGRFSPALGAQGRYSPAPGAGAQNRSPSPTNCLPAAKRTRVDEDYHQSEIGLNLSSSAKISNSSTAADLSSTTCVYCNIVYPNQTLYFLHRGFHSESNPWRCNSCGHVSSDLYDFNTHLFSASHK